MASPATLNTKQINDSFDLKAPASLRDKTAKKVGLIMMGLGLILIIAGIATVSAGLGPAHGLMLTPLSSKILIVSSLGATFITSFALSFLLMRKIFRQSVI